MTHLESLPPRVFGLETEYGIMAVSQSTGEVVADAEVVGREIFRPVLEETRSTSQFLPNGGRIYLDVGDHPEYATAECLTLDDLLAQDRAGAQILTQMTQQAALRLSEKFQAPVQIHLFRNNLDAAGNSCGCHENYLLYRNSQFRSLVEGLVSFLVTRQIITGAGGVLRIQGKPVFCQSQRAFQIDDSISAATTSSRPLVNTRDEPHGDATKFRRLHVIVGDSNILETPTRFKVASLNLVLAALEAGIDFSDLSLTQPIAALRSITQDLGGGKTSVELSNGRSWTALEIQREYLERLQETFSQAQLPPEYPQIFRDWQYWLECLASQDFAALSGILDWPTKYILGEKLRQKHGWEWGSAQLGRVFLGYHDLSSQGLHLDKQPWVKRLTEPSSVDLAKTQPPKDTRAWIRGNLLQIAALKGLDLQADWTHLRLSEPHTGTVTLNDPFACSDVQALKLQEIMEEA